MRLGLGIDVWGSSKVQLPLRQILLAEQLGFDSVWTAEIYGADAVTPLAFLAAHTRYLRLGSAVAQVPARPPTTTAMQFATIDALAPGRVVCGLGLSGPRIAEGWYGQPWGRPSARLRDYVAIMRQVLRREGPVSHEGPEIHLPYHGPGSTGSGQPMKSILHPNPDLPIFLAAGGPVNVQLTAEVADGWLPLGYTPGSAHLYTDDLAAGLVRGGRAMVDLEIQTGAMLCLTDDVGSTLNAAKPGVAMRVGGYGTTDQNFHRDAMIRRGFSEAAERITELFSAGRREEATEAVPDDYIDDGALVGSEARITERFEQWQTTQATGLTVRPSTDAEMILIARLAGCEPRLDVNVPPRSGGARGGT